MKTVMFDIDGCVADVVTPFLVRVNDEGHKLKMEEILSHDLTESLQMDSAAIWDIFKHIIQRGQYDPIPGVAEFMYNYNHESRQTPFFCTARCETTRIATRRWLREWLRLDPYVVHQTLDFDKRNTARLIGATHAIEDRSETAVELAMDGVQVALFTQPWNTLLKENKYNNLTRVNNWEEAWGWYLNN